MENAVFEIDELSGSHTAKTAKQALDALPGVRSVTVDGETVDLSPKEYELLFYNQQSTMGKAAVPEEPKIEETPASAPVDQKPASPAAANPPLVTEAYGVKKPDVPKTPVAAPVQKLQEDELDLSAVEIGTAVTHKSFGAGTVTWIDKAQKHIRVTLSACEKTFIFPDAFTQGFLKL